MIKYKQWRITAILPLYEPARPNISNVFPITKKPVAGYPVNTFKMEVFQPLFKVMLKEAEEKLKKPGGPVFKIDIMDELKELSKNSPEEPGTSI